MKLIALWQRKSDLTAWACFFLYGGIRSKKKGGHAIEFVKT